MFKDITGQVFGNWTVLSRAPDKNHSRFMCRCSCGKTREVRSDALRYGESRSCGCLPNSGRLKPRHGLWTSKEWMAWSSMRQRCSNPKTRGYARYGGRGIKVCERWHVFENFFADMGRRPSPKHSLDRINNDGDYEPSNCRWATAQEQQSNTRTCKIYEGKTASQWAREHGIRPNTLLMRLARGIPLQRALAMK